MQNIVTITCVARARRPRYENSLSPYFAILKSIHDGLSGVNTSASANDAFDLKSIGFLPEQNQVGRLARGHMRTEGGPPQQTSRVRGGHLDG